MEQVFRLIHTRRSVRTYDGTAITPEHLELLRTYMQNIPTPWGVAPEFRLLEAEKYGLKSPVVTGANWYFAAKLPRSEHAEEALGFAFEKLVLYAWSLGMGTVWLGGTLNRPAFEAAMELGSGEFMPCASPVGYPGKKPTLRENLMRKGIKADTRLPFTELFFSGDFSAPLTEGAAEDLREPLEAVRLAPSAVNKQPWRAVVSADTVHFYVKHDKGLSGEATGDLQKIDLGIALCHFCLTAEAIGFAPMILLSDPGLKTEAGTEYIASCRITR